MTRVNLISFFAAFFSSIYSYGQENSNPICIGEQFMLKSEILVKERDIFVRLPEGYDSSSTKYPVHYVLDGEYTFYTYSGIIQLKSKMDEIPDAIVVGIPNVNRNFDLRPDKNANAFMDFITKELIPSINEQYKTNGTNILFGYSSAGNFVVNNFLSNTGYFDIFISGSPYGLSYYSEFNWKDFMEQLKEPKKLYLSMGDKDNENHREQYNTFYRKINLEKNDLIDLKYEITTNQSHETNFLLSIQGGLNYIYKDWNSDEK